MDGYGDLGDLGQLLVDQFEAQNDQLQQQLHDIQQLMHAPHLPPNPHLFEMHNQLQQLQQMAPMAPAQAAQVPIPPQPQPVQLPPPPPVQMQVPMAVAAPPPLPPPPPPPMPQFHVHMVPGAGWDFAAIPLLGFAPFQQGQFGMQPRRFAVARRGGGVARRGAGAMAPLLRPQAAAGAAAPQPDPLDELMPQPLVPQPLFENVFGEPEVILDEGGVPPAQLPDGVFDAARDAAARHAARFVQNAVAAAAAAAPPAAGGADGPGPRGGAIRVRVMLAPGAAPPPPPANENQPVGQADAANPRALPPMWNGGPLEDQFHDNLRDMFEDQLFGPREEMFPMHAEPADDEGPERRRAPVERTPPREVPPRIENPTEQEINASCPICILPFKNNADSSRVAKVLSCGHLICGGCVKEFVKTLRENRSYSYGKAPCVVCQRQVNWRSLPECKTVGYLYEQLELTNEERKPADEASQLRADTRKRIYRHLDSVSSSCHEMASKIRKLVRKADGVYDQSLEMSSQSSGRDTMSRVDCEEQADWLVGKVEQEADRIGVLEKQFNEHYEKMNTIMEEISSNEFTLPKVFPKSLPASTSSD